MLLCHTKRKLAATGSWISLNQRLLKQLKSTLPKHARIASTSGVSMLAASRGPFRDQVSGCKSRNLAVASWSLLLLQQGRGSSESNTVIFHVNLPQAPGGILERSWKQIRRDANCKTCYYDYLWRLDTLVELPRDRLCRKDFQTPSG